MQDQANKAQPHAVIFDVGNVLFHWNPRQLFERLIPDGQALDAFLGGVATPEWHLQHDLGRPFAETSAELIARHPQEAAFIAAWGERYAEMIGPPVEGMAALVGELDSAGVPLFCITNFSGEFFRPFRDVHATLFDRFRDIVVSGDEKLIKPDPAIYRLALERFGLQGPDAVFVDDNPDNVEGAARAGIHAVLFTDAPSFRAELTRLGLLA